jgi:hypothetical protein
MELVWNKRGLSLMRARCQAVSLNTQLACNEAQPARSETQSSESEAQPPCNDTQPAGSETQPPCNDTQPPGSETQTPVIGDAKAEQWIGSSRK